MDNPTKREGVIKLVRDLKAAGCRVFSLERIRFGSLTLDETLPRGAWRALTRDEVNAILPGYLDKNGVPTMARNWRET